MLINFCTFSSTSLLLGGGYGGACVQCSCGDCLTAFHPHCTYSNGLSLICRVDAHHCAYYEIFCRKHDPCEQKGVRGRDQSVAAPYRRDKDKSGGSGGSTIRIPCTHLLPASSEGGAKAALLTRRASNSSSYPPSECRSDGLEDTAVESSRPPTARG